MSRSGIDAPPPGPALQPMPAGGHGRAPRRAPAMRILVHLLAVSIATAWLSFAPRSAGAQGNAALGCLARDRIECGCAIRLAGFTCTGDETSGSDHLYSGPTDGSPLWIMVNGREIELKSDRRASRSFGFSRGDSWTETYVASGMSVAVSYRPGSNTCRKPPPDTCEYFDVQATVLIERDQYPPLRLEGVGTCGC